jgi:hypothetical protein
MVAVDKFHPLTYDERKNMKNVSGSSITGCPFLYWDEIVNGNKEELSRSTKQAFRIGKKFHKFKEIENKHNPYCIDIEESLYLHFEGSGKIKEFLIRVTPDCLKQGWQCRYYEDYKTTKAGGWKYKFDEYEKGLSPGYKLQLSIQNYAGYVFDGDDVRKGVIVYINKNDPDWLDQMSISDDLLSLEATELYIFTHPAITEKEEDLLNKTREFKNNRRTNWLCRAWEGHPECHACEEYIDRKEAEREKEELDDFEGDY